MNVVEILREQVKTRGDTPALVDARSGAMSFAELETASGRAAQLLWHAGLRPGDAVLVLHPVATELYVILIALFRLNLTAVFVDPGAGVAQIDRCCARYPVKAFIGGAKAHLLRFVSPALRRVPLKFSAGMPLPGAICWKMPACVPGSGVPAVPCPPETPALVSFTSGSTGEPKTVVRSHGFLVAQQRAVAANMRFAPGDVVLAGLPMFVLSHLACGVASVLPAADLRRPGDADPAPLVRQIRDVGVTGMELPPSLLERISEYCVHHQENLPGVRQVYVGGAPVFPGLMERCRRAVPNASLVAIYGSTEAEPIAEITHHEITNADLHAMLGGRGILAGAPIPQIAVHILPDRWGEPIGPYGENEFAAASLPAGEPGEIVVSGEHVLAGYWRGEGDALIKFRVGETVWHRTGDAGYLDALGRLWLMGRCAARVSDERGTLYPLAVECAVSDDPAAGRAAFVKYEGRRLLVVEPRRRFSSYDLDALKRRLAWAKLDDVRSICRIPVDRRHNSKIDYPALTAKLRQRLGGVITRPAHALRQKDGESRSMLLRIRAGLHFD